MKTPKKILKLSRVFQVLMGLHTKISKTKSLINLVKTRLRVIKVLG